MSKNDEKSKILKLMKDFEISMKPDYRGKMRGDYDIAEEVFDLFEDFVEKYIENNDEIPFLFRSKYGGFPKVHYRRGYEGKEPTYEWKMYIELPNYAKIEADRKFALKVRAWLWKNYNDETMLTDYGWLGKFTRPKTT